MDTIQNRIQKAIYVIDRPYPADNLIQNYSDFLSVRDHLHLLSFNIKVFESLIDLTIVLWQSDKRISRISLIESIKKYGYHISPKSDLTPPIKKFVGADQQIGTKIFKLFCLSFEQNTHIKQSQLSVLQATLNSLILKFNLSDNEQEWLCDNVHKSQIIPT